MPIEVLSSTVIDPPHRMPRQPKLRSSCDGCGAAKLKCDRSQPACGRCFSLNLKCVYGVSRKTGKPPAREALSSWGAGHVSHIRRARHAGSHDKDRRNNSCSRGIGGLGYDGIVRNSGQVVDGQPINLGMSVSAPAATHSDLFRHLLPNFTSLEFDDSLFSDMETGPFSTLATPESESYAPAASQTDASQTQVDESRHLDSVLLQPVSSKGHDCFREAYHILDSLSFHRLNNLNSTLESPSPGSASTTASTANRVPLDDVLRLNREASERLGRLLTCSCAGLPQLTMLYASIISQVLIGYQQAADCTQSASPAWSPADIRLDTASHHMSLTGSSPSSGSGSGAGPSTWSSTAASTLNAGGGKSTPSLIQFPGPVAPAKMAIGTFNIDDLRVQTALKIQLLSGEMRRAGRLIDQFAVHNFDGECVTDEYTFGGVHSLYQSLDAWLRSEHLRIANMMKSKLRELNS